MKPDVPTLHLPTDARILGLPDFMNRAAQVARPHVAIHARAWQYDGRALLESAERLREHVTPAGAAVFVNDRADVARIAGLHLHLPAHGLPILAARQLLGDDVLIGRSTHSAAEALEAWDSGADFVFLGPIWPTASHPDRTPLGPEVIARAHPARVIAIGGMTPERARMCRDAGAHGVAAISAVWDAAEPGSVVEAMLLSLGV